jgi:uncharacterized membrane protein
LSTVNKVKILATIALVALAAVGTYVIMHIGIDTTVDFLLTTGIAGLGLILIAAAIVGLGVCLYAIWVEMRSS